MINPSFQNLISIGHKLRSPNGCPWDRKQSLASWTKYVGNELEELKTALKNRDREKNHSPAHMGFWKR